MRYKRVLLVAPRFYAGKFKLAMHPLTGLAYVAEALNNAGIEVNVIDMNLQYSDNDLRERIINIKPDLIGITVMTFNHRNVYRLINRIKSEFPRIKIMAGGPHISTLREKVLKDCDGLDYGIILEGDINSVELCNGKAFDNIQGLIYRNNGKILVNGYNNFIQDLDSLTFPKYQQFELDRYPAKQIGIITSRGCPYNCIYCPVIAAIGKKFRMRNAYNVVGEIEYWYNKGYREIYILDDNFTLSRKRVEEICALLKDINMKGINLHCPNGVRADKVDRGLLEQMKDVGFNMLAFGVESANDNILNNIKKGENIATIEKAIKDACELGFDVDLFFLIGSPGETIEDVNRSFDLALRYPVRSAKFYNIIPFPTTELYEWLVNKHYLLKPIDEILENASHYINEPCFITPEMSANEREKAFNAGKDITNYIRRKYIERKIKAPYYIKKVISKLYILPKVDDIVNCNRNVARAKEWLKRLLKVIHKI